MATIATGSSSSQSLFPPLHVEEKPSSKECAICFIALEKILEPKTTPACAQFKDTQICVLCLPKHKEACSTCRENPENQEEEEPLVQNAQSNLQRPGMWDWLERNPCAFRCFSKCRDCLSSSFKRFWVK